jgi:hypothetical protein
VAPAVGDKGGGGNEKNLIGQGEHGERSQEKRLLRVDVMMMMMKTTKQQQCRWR